MSRQRDRDDRSPCDGCDRLVAAPTLTERLGALLCPACWPPLADPCRAAIPQRPLCAASELLSDRHHVGVDRARYVIWADGHVWRFCTAACLTAWARARVRAAS